MKRRVFCAIGLIAMFAASGAYAQTPARPADTTCDQTPLRHLPARATDAPTGSEFARAMIALSGAARDAAIREQILRGNVPSFLRRLVPVTLRTPASSETLTVCVLPDYLAVGSDRDFIFVPMGLLAALDVARDLGFELPTPRIVDAIYDEAEVQLRPQPLPAGDQMRSTSYLVRHSEMISEQRDAASAPLGALTSGHKKDLVLTHRLWEIPGRVAIYGWHRASGAPIQPLSTVHGARYADYSHGIRLVSDIVYLNGVRRNIADLLGEPTLSRLLSNEGPFTGFSARVSALIADLGGTELQQRKPR